MWSRWGGKDALLEEHPHSITTQFVTILQKQTLVYALLRIFLTSICLCLEGSDKESVRRTWNDDITIALYEGKRLGIVPERQLGETSEGRSEFWKIFLLIVLVGGVCSRRRDCGSMRGGSDRVEYFVSCRFGGSRLGLCSRIRDCILDRGWGRFGRDVLDNIM